MAIAQCRYCDKFFPGTNLDLAKAQREEHEASCEKAAAVKAISESLIKGTGTGAILSLPEMMTIRDHFAAAALQGLLAKYDPREGTEYEHFNSAKPDHVNSYAIGAYNLADAMLAARSTTEPSAKDSAMAAMEKALERAKEMLGHLAADHLEGDDAQTQACIREIDTALERVRGIK